MAEETAETSPEEPTPPPPEPSEPDALQASKALFRQAQQLRKESGCARAVPLYLESRALNPAQSNTLNAALCLEQLGRGDEALELYEALVVEQAGRLGAERDEAIRASIRRLRDTVGMLTVRGGAEGATVIVDGRRRGTLPLATPIPVLAGTRELRVIKDGHEPFVTAVDMVLAQPTEVTASTPLLTQSGKLEVQLDELVGGQVLIDGAPVGEVPWSGKLAPGSYLLQIALRDRGTAPRLVQIVAGQTASLDLEAAPLGAELTVVSEPPGASLTLGDDEVPLGAGRWRGRLPVGRWVVHARTEGYLDGALEVVSSDDGPAERLVVRLDVDDDHARWASEPLGTFFVDLLGGAALAPSVGGASASCDEQTCSRSSLGVGGLVGARGGLELPMGLSFEVLGGYLSIRQAVDRSAGASFDTASTSVPATYNVFNRLSLQGGFVAGGVGYRLTLAEPLELRLGAALGGAFLRARDAAEGTASAAGNVAPVDVAGAGQGRTVIDLLLLPQIALAAQLDALTLGLGLATPVLVLGGPSDTLGDAFVRGACDPETDPTAVACAPGQDLFEDQTLYDPMVMVVPMAQVGYRFE